MFRQAIWWPPRLARIPWCSMVGLPGKNWLVSRWENWTSCRIRKARPPPPRQGGRGGRGCIREWEGGRRLLWVLSPAQRKPQLQVSGAWWPAPFWSCECRYSWIGQIRPSRVTVGQAQDLRWEEPVGCTRPGTEAGPITGWALGGPGGGWRWGRG